MKLLNSQTNSEQEIINTASTIIKSGGLAILPFDTVYGFACDPTDQAALDRIFKLKGRATTKTLGIAASDLEQVSNIALTENKDLEKYFPGRYTVLLPISPVGESLLSPDCFKDGIVGIRIPDQPLLLEIIDHAGGLIAQTSANKSGQPPCFSLAEIKSQFTTDELASLDLILDAGPIESRGASELINYCGATPETIERN